MNFVFISGIIIKDINFDFLYNSNKISIAYSKIKIDNDSIITINGYDNVADFMYSQLSIDSKVSIFGKLISNDTVQIIELYQI